MNQTIKKRILLFLLGMMGMGIGLSASLRVDMGLAALDAFNKDLTYFLPITQGISMWITAVILTVIQMIILRKEYKLSNLRSILGMGSVGIIVDFVGMLIINVAFPTDYLGRMIVFLIAQVITAVSISLVLYADLLIFPFEQTAGIIAQKINQPFGRVRFTMELGVVILVLILTFIFKLPGQIKEGTIIILLISSPVITLTTSLSKKYLPLKEENK